MILKVGFVLLLGNYFRLFSLLLVASSERGHILVGGLRSLLLSFLIIEVAMISPKGTLCFILNFYWLCRALILGLLFLLFLMFGIAFYVIKWLFLGYNFILIKYSLVLVVEALIFLLAYLLCCGIFFLSI